jgi:hypothetical protein
MKLIKLDFMVLIKMGLVCKERERGCGEMPMDEGCGEMPMDEGCGGGAMDR